MSFRELNSFQGDSDSTDYWDETMTFKKKWSTTSNSVFHRKVTIIQTTVPIITARGAPKANTQITEHEQVASGSHPNGKKLLSQRSMPCSPEPRCLESTYILNNSTSTVKAPRDTARVGLFVSSGSVFATTRNIERERDREREREVGGREQERHREEERAGLCLENTALLGYMADANVDYYLSLPDSGGLMLLVDI